MGFEFQERFTDDIRDFNYNQIHINCLVKMTSSSISLKATSQIAAKHLHKLINKFLIAA